MKITQLYTYPIKSLRSVSLATTTVTPHGFPHDRHFMLVKIHKDNSTRPRSKRHFNTVTNLENMTITKYPELSLFLQSIDDPAGTFTVTYKPPGSAQKSMEIELEPDYTKLDQTDILLHQSPTKAYNMGDKINGWFSECIGYDVMLVYLGPHRRPVLGNLAPRATPAKSNTWLSSITSYVPNLRRAKVGEDDGISFADVAAYLVVTEESLNDVSSRLADGLGMDVTKFRPNIVVSGSQAAWDEDYWGGLVFRPSPDDNGSDSKVEITLTQNCARCVSINVDYSTGQAGKGDEGNVLKKLMEDRRVDNGTKYSPIFGRYGFLHQSSFSGGRTLSVGNEVFLSKRILERTTFGEYINSNH
ncbi:MAG: hypothetical protein Q9217_003524 [Psora testacea]